jgi:hypothetical protein
LASRGPQAGQISRSFDGDSEDSESGVGQWQERGGSGDMNANFLEEADLRIFSAFHRSFHRSIHINSSQLIHLRPSTSIYITFLGQRNFQLLVASFCQLPAPDTSEGTGDHGNHGPNGQGETTEGIPIIPGIPEMTMWTNVD